MWRNPFPFDKPEPLPSKLYSPDLCHSTPWGDCLKGGSDKKIQYLLSRERDDHGLTRGWGVPYPYLSRQVSWTRKRIVFVKANTNCLPLEWVMFITLLRRDPHLNQVKTESSQTLTSKVNHGTTPAVDISFCWYALCCWYPMISYIDNLLLISTWYQHQFFPPSHALLPLSKQTCANKYVQINLCKQTYANKHVQTNMCK